VVCPLFLLALALALPLAAAAQVESEPAPAPLPDPLAGEHLRPALLWSLLPGAGHIYLGDTGTGLTYAGLTALFLAGGLEVERRNDDLGPDRDEDEVNVPLLVGQKVWEYSIFTTARSAMAKDGIDLRAHRFDDTPTSQLLTAPFGRQALRLPVIAAGLLGAGFAAVGAHHREGRLEDVRRARMFGNTYERDDATRLYAASAFGISLGAATAEEGLFRGLLQPYLQDDLGQTRGRWAAAGLFGAAHLAGADGELNVGGALFATAAGGYLGWLYDRDDARLPGPIAAHFWYDFMLLATSWALDPDENALGVDVEFSF
jgi:membrane protease YdiL (CAAX protease family)